MNLRSILLVLVSIACILLMSPIEACQTPYNSTSTINQVNEIPQEKVKLDKIKSYIVQKFPTAEASARASLIEILELI